MKHLGSITDLHGYDIPPVDCITGGSPCQDLSLAGKRAGLAGERSGLFMEQVRLVKEMRDATNGIRPRYMVWENVYGAFSSNGGKDFQTVLTEIARIAEPNAPDVPMPEKGRWSKSGCIYDEMGRWSIAWRVHDAQFWGVPQRRVRVSVVADFGGLSAPEILFVRKGLFGDSEESSAEREAATGGIENRAGKPDSVIPINTMLATRDKALGERTGLGVGNEGDAQFTIFCGTLSCGNVFQPKCKRRMQTWWRRKLCADNQLPRTSRGGGRTMTTAGGGLNEHIPVVLDNHPNDSRVKISADGIVQTLSGRMGTGGGNTPMVMQEPISIGNGQLAGISMKPIANTLDCMHDQQAVIHHTVRRLTPVECERLQGFPDRWTDIGKWTDSRGKQRDSSDRLRYKALGNSIALPFWFYLLRRISAQYERPATLGSLFDGIGGFPLCWEACNGQGTALWASEIDEFCIAVTKKRLGSDEE